MRDAIAKAPTTGARIDIQHGYYRVVGVMRGPGALSVAYAGMTRIAEGEGAQPKDAVADVIHALDARLARFLSSRDADGMPSEAEYRDAIDAIPIAGSESLLRLLRFHGRRPGHAATAAQIARMATVDEKTVWFEYGRLGRKLHAFLKLAKLKKAASGERFTVESFAVVSRADEQSPWVITLRPAFVAALSPEPSPP